MIGENARRPGEPAPPDEHEELDALLDDALRQTFPASDPIAINIERSRKQKRDRTSAPE